MSSGANPKSGFPKESSVKLSMSNNVPKGGGMVVKSAEFRGHPQSRGGQRAGRLYDQVVG